jgi:hypothetical protein
LTPNHASAAGCRRSLLLAVGWCCCCHRCCQPSPGVWHVRGTHDAVLRRSSQDRVLAGYAKSAPRSVGRRSRSACPVPARPSRSSWKPTRGHYGISSAGACSSAFLQSSTAPSSWHNSRQEGSRG